MDNFKSRWSNWTPETHVKRATAPTVPDSNTPKYRTDNADNAVQTNSIVSAVSAIVKDKSSEAPPMREER